MKAEQLRWRSLSPSHDSPKVVELLFAKDEQLQHVNANHIQPPRLQFRKCHEVLRNMVPDDAVTAFAYGVDTRGREYKVVGTVKGHVLWRHDILDSHESDVLNIATSINGAFFASCSRDGRVVVTNAATGERKKFTGFPSAVTCVTLSPEFNNFNDEFACSMANGKIILARNSWLGRREYVVLRASNNIVTKLHWEANGYLTYVSFTGVTVINMRSNQDVGFLKRPRIIDKSSCNLYWHDRRQLVISWGTDISVVELCSDKNRMLMRNKSKELSIKVKYITEYPICGISPFFDNQTGRRELMTLQLIEGPQVRLLLTVLSTDPQSEDKKELFKSEIRLKNHQKLLPRNLILYHKHGQFFIIAPNEVLRFQYAKIRDRVEWLRKKKRYIKALALVEESDGNPVRNNNHVNIPVGPAETVHKLRQEYVAELLSQGRYKQLHNLIQANGVFLPYVEMYSADIRNLVDSDCDNVDSDLLALYVKILLNKPEQLEETLYRYLLENISMKKALKERNATNEDDNAPQEKKAKEEAPSEGAQKDKKTLILTTAEKFANATEPLVDEADYSCLLDVDGN